jgi:hypothetical protein
MDKATCAACGTVLDVDLANAGLAVVCPNCGQLVTAPAGVTGTGGARGTGVPGEPGCPGSGGPEASRRRPAGWPRPR